MNDLDISLLRTFISLASTKNFTQTAKRVHRSQSAVSMQLAKLEEQLGCQLFERDKRNVKLTLEGERLRNYASQIVSLSENLINHFSQQEVSGTINFASPEDFATYFLPDILAEFVKAHPGVDLNVNCDFTLSLISDFEKEKYDLIVIKQEPGNLYKGARPLLREELVWVGNDKQAQGLRFKRTVKHYMDKLGYLPLVLSPSPCVYRQGALAALDKSGIRWRVVYTSPSFAGTIAAVQAGLGFTVLPRDMVPATLNIYERTHAWPKLQGAEICLLAKPEITPAIETLIEYIFERISIIKAI